MKYPAKFSEKDFNATVFSARRVPDRHHFQFVECMHCGMIFSDPVIGVPALIDLYTQAKVTYSLEERNIYSSYATVLDRAVSRLEKRKVMVEIGGGHGFMLKYSDERGFQEAIEIEPSKNAEERFVPFGENSRFVRSIFSQEILPENFADLIFFFQVLDHVPNPREFLTSVYSNLEPGGMAVCITHDSGALTAKLLGEASPIFDIEHTYLFNKKNIRALFSEVGFSDIESFSISNCYSLRYWCSLLPMPASLKGWASALLRYLYLENVNLKFFPGNMAVIASKKSLGG
ncbi:MAG: class I SAM-dependent methyltransferase [Candidatus Pacebacteria bacterium]|nr:class I SAM-dependent methyltransferase [Candidatus Paceibacterota bacterium]